MFFGERVAQHKSRLYVSEKQYYNIFTHPHILFRKFIKISNQEKNVKVSITAQLQSQQSVSKQWQALTNSSSSKVNATFLTLYVQYNLETAPIA